MVEITLIPKINDPDPTSRRMIFKRSFVEKDSQEKGCRKKLCRERITGRIFMKKDLWE
jgi:hypothetical protein